MAKVYKVTMYLPDPNGYYDLHDTEHFQSELESGLQRVLDISPVIADIQESEVFEWHDDLKINGMSSSFDDYEEYIK